MTGAESAVPRSVLQKFGVRGPVQKLSGGQGNVLAFSDVEASARVPAALKMPMHASCMAAPILLARANREGRLQEGIGGLYGVAGRADVHAQLLEAGRGGLATRLSGDGAGRAELEAGGVLT